MKTVLTIAAVASLTGVAQAQTAATPQQSMPLEDSSDLAPLPIAQQTALRCGVAIAVATEMQRAGAAEDRGWPNLLENNRGREFFVRSMAKLMDDTGLPRESIALYSQREAERLRDEESLDDVMPACLLMLDASGL